MNISIRPTTAPEAEILADIQKAAFLPLYEKYHDKGSPYLRGAEDILRRLNKHNRYFTILCNGDIVATVQDLSIIKSKRVNTIFAAFMFIPRGKVTG